VSVWIIEPRDPLIVRDGRPFGPFPGARAFSLKFPFPSTVAGGVRTRVGLYKYGRFGPDVIQEIKRIRVRGPLLAELETTGEDVAEWLVPAPADALLLDLEPADPGRAMLKRLVPLELPSGAKTDLSTIVLEEVALVGLPQRDPRKPCKAAPGFWRWTFFEKWLEMPVDQEVTFAAMGHDGPVPEVRMHVGIRPETQTADEERGALFQTRGLEFARLAEPGKLKSARRLGLIVEADTTGLKPGIAPLGGERRLVYWRSSRQAFPTLSPDLKQKILDQRHCRLILLTPACFLDGWKPRWLLDRREGVKPTLRAAAVKRPAVVSGWSFEHGKPKPTRRLAPAGTVYFLRLEGKEAAIARWLEAVWMQAVSDGEQDRRDGFGLAVLGAWDGKLRPMEVEKEHAQAATR
jgi:CRISPR-associated protein Cmr3